MKIKPFIVGKSINLRPLTRADLDGNYINWFNDAEVCLYNSHHVYPYGQEQAAQYISAIQNNKNDLVLAISDKKNDKHIGNVSLQKIDLVSRNAEYAIILGEKEYWGKGIAKEASLLILKHGFEQLNLHRIYCGTSENNKAMQKLASALGMKEEGRRKEVLYKDGKYADIIEYGLLRKNFQTLK
ncbi:MAG: GNAT family protein [Candidatus Paceibacterota bacterium]|jgi:RimJ/RimL family protein N-acetyltransferase